MDIMITFDTAITQHTTATRRLQSVSLQMATSKREMDGIQLDPTNFFMASKFDAQVHLMEGAPSNCQGGREPVVNRSRQSRCSPGHSRARERAIDCRALVFDLR